MRHSSFARLVLATTIALGVGVHLPGEPARAQSAAPTHLAGAKSDSGKSTAHHKVDLAAAKALLTNKDYSAAESLYREALRQAPKSPELLTDLGIALQLEGKSSEAIYTFEQALRQKYRAITYALLAEERCKTRDLDGARPMLARIISVRPIDKHSMSIVAPCYLDLDEPIEAVQAYTALLDDPDFPPDLATIQLAKAYLSSAQFFVKKLRAAKNGASYFSAIQAARDGQATDARSAFPAAAAASPWFKPELDFAQAVAVWKRHTDDTALLYQLSVQSGEESMRYVQLCNDKYPESPYLQQLLADVLADQGRVDEAVASYESLMQSHPDLPALRYSLGMLYNKQQQWQKSLEVFKPQLAANPQDERAAARISEALLELQQYSELRAFLRPRVATPHAPLWARLDLATAEQKLGNSAAAIAQLLAAERDGSTQTAVHYRLARLYTMTGDSANAAREKALFQKSSQ